MKEKNMNNMTEQSKHPYHHVFIGTNGKYATLAILNGNGEGGYDHWRIDMVGHSRITTITNASVMQDYWQDYVDLKVIQNIYKVLDFYVKEEDNVTELNAYESEKNFCSDDVPF